MNTSELRAERIRQGKSVDYMAEVIGKTNDTYSKKERGYDTGLGGGVTDRLEEVKTEQMLRRMEIVPVNFGMKPPQDGSEEHYEDISTYMWATIKTLMENKEISIENDEELVAQFSVRKYSITSNGKIVLESKKTMKARGIKSPDRADAVALSCYSQNKVYNAFIERTETVMISYDVLRTLPIAQINVGVSIGNAFIGTSSFMWDDSILVDAETERARDQQEVVMELMAKYEYRMKWYGEDEETAKAKIEEMKNPTDDEILGFGREIDDESQLGKVGDSNGKEQ